MELRDIEIFLTLAEELHFGRAAARLRVSQARVSQAIRAQERRLGGALFDRSNRRRIVLTPLGRQLREDLLPLYQGLLDSLERARLTAQGISDRLRVGLTGVIGPELRPLWDAFRARHPRCELVVRFNDPFRDPFGPLHRGDLDVLITWLPVEEPGLTVGPVVSTDGRVLAVASDHPLAGEGPVSMEILGDDQRTVTTQPDVPEYWENAVVPFHTPSGRAIGHRLRVTSFEDILTLVGTGQAIVPLTGHVTRFYARPDIAYLPIHDALVQRYALTWRADDDNPLVHEFARTVKDLGVLRHE
ncbi:LysR family transcriptional regulator [Actinomadura nitritigenes]|uniref:LysR family transcriptional regulator n=1 Tax=Actinomadura nitritigenes TaxID=134602 RepID=UPI003D94785E